MGKVIRVEKIPKKVSKESSEPIDHLLATFCYYYQQYTFAQAKKLPYKRVTMMLRVAQKVEAIRMRNLVQIAAAPHFDNGKGVTKLTEHYNSIIEGEENG